MSVALLSFLYFLWPLHAFCTTPYLWLLRFLRRSSSPTSGLFLMRTWILHYWEPIYICYGVWQYTSMNGENPQLVSYEPVEFEKPVVVQDFTKFTEQFRGVYRWYLKLIKKNRKMSTCNRLDLGTLGCRPVMPKNLPGHWYTYMCMWCALVILILRWDARRND